MAHSNDTFSMKPAIQLEAGKPFRRSVRPHRSASLRLKQTAVTMFPGMPLLQSITVPRIYTGSIHVPPKHTLPVISGERRKRPEAESRTPRVMHESRVEPMTTLTLQESGVDRKTPRIQGAPSDQPIPYEITPNTHLKRRFLDLCQQMATTPNTSDSRSRLDRSLVGSRGLSGLARRLSHKERRNHERKTMRQRSVSLDCGDGRHPLNPAPTTPEHPPSGGMSLAIPTSPSLPSKLGRNNSSTQNLPGRLSRKSSGNKVSRLASDSSSENLALKDKKKRSVYDIQSLFDAVEHADMETVQAVLDSNSLDINSVNEELLTPLDVAIMTNHVPMAKMLLSYGARENPRYQRSDETRALQLNSLVSYTQRHIDEILSRISLNSNNLTVSNSQQKETERQWAHWEFKHKLMKRMRAGYEHARIPTEPTSVSLSVLSSTSLMIKFNEPEQNNGAVITRYKVEWSCYEDFTPLAGEQIMDDPGYRHLEIPSLIQGNAYYVRVSAWNMKGYGPTALSNPAYAIPSSWREVDDIRPRTEGKMDSLTDLFTNIKNFRLPSASEIKDASTPGTSPLHPRKSNMRKSLKNLFSNTAPRFQRNLKRGIYISCLLYNEDKILVTNEDNLPILEVDENFTGTNLNSDFHWLMKIACTWEDVKTLRQDLDKSASSSYMMFRSKILQAATQLQSSLGVQDLGQFFYKPIRDASGSLILTVVNSVPDAKAVNTTHAKWLPLPKLQKKITQSVSTNGTGNSPENVQAPEMLLTYLPEMIDYQQSSGKSLPRGLYLGYLKLKSSVDQIQIMVPESMPNILPHTRVRDCPNVTREEWQWLRNISLSNIQASPTAQQIVFQDLVVSKCQTLLNMLGVSEDDAVCHRLYDIEVIDLSEDVSFLLLLPPVEAVCSIPGHTEEITEKPGYMMLPVQVFEMVHMCTYQSDFISRYSRASSILEMDAYLSQQAHREAFSSEELSSTRDRVDQLSTFQQRLDETWKGVRWTMDIVSYARDKNLRGGTPLGVLFAPPQSPNDSPSSDRRDFNDVLSLCTIGGSGSVGACSGTGSSDMGYHSDRSSIGDHGNSEVSTPTMKDTCAHHSPAPPLPPTTETNLDKPCPGTGSGTSSEEGSDEVWTRAPPPGIVRVYAAYETGLQRGACVKLQVTARTRSREVVNLVIQQLNKAAIMKGVMTHLYSEDQLDDFCLVAIIGARERVLRDSYQPLSLQNPWTNGKLYVRLKNNILAALEQGQVTSV